MENFDSNRIRAIWGATSNFFKNRCVKTQQDGGDSEKDQLISCDGFSRRMRVCAATARPSRAAAAIAADARRKMDQPSRWCHLAAVGGIFGPTLSLDPTSRAVDRPVRQSLWPVFQSQGRGFRGQSAALRMQQT